MLAAGLAVTQIAPPEPADFLPVVRLRTDGGLFVTFVHRKAAKHAACSRIVKVFAETLSRSCPTCTIESSDCATELNGVEGALARNETLPIYTVDADAIRMAIVGPPAAVHEECEAMASELKGEGIKAAACRVPAGRGQL